MKQMTKNFGDLGGDVKQILFTEETIRQRVEEIGRAISTDYAGKNLLVIGVLKGILMFMADLLRSISIPVEVDFIAVSSYSSEARERGLVRLVKDLDISMTDRHVLFVEDVIDTGLTINYILTNLRTRNPASLEVCTLFDKSKHRLINIPIKYKGFDLPDRFVVGYGLDHREHYRNLPYVGLLKSDALITSRK